MANHPSRAWRRRAEAAALDWLLPRTTLADGAHLLTVDELMQVRREAFLAGYEAGRLDGRPKTP